MALSAEEKELRALVGRRVGTRLPGAGYCEGTVTSVTEPQGLGGLGGLWKALVAFDGDGDAKEMDAARVAKILLPVGTPLPPASDVKSDTAAHGASPDAKMGEAGEAGEGGEAGEDFSILDITPEYLEETLPLSYKAADLLKVCAVQDGKDFMIETPRSNTMITRAAWSDKVR